MWTFIKKENSYCSNNVDCVRYSMNSSHSPKIIAVAGGKGGVGKTVFACMLGMCLAGFKKRTILVDLDFSGGKHQDLFQCPKHEKTFKY